MSSRDDVLAYNNDKRTQCRYGAKCYQKNAIHHSKYKHPNIKEGANSESVQPKKKPRLDESEELFNASAEESTEDEYQLPNHISNADVPSTSQTVVKQDDSKLPNKENEEENTGYEDTNVNVQNFIKSRFLVDMPKDFYSFWDFCKTLNENRPLEALKGIGFILCGPFEVLADKFNGIKKFKKNEYLRHWRYFYDPPEFQTVIRHVSTGYHFGYFRDDLNSSDCFVAANDVNKGCQITGMGDNLFTALKNYLDVFSRTFDPFAKIKVTSILKALSAKHGNELNQFLNIKKRERKIVCKTFHKMGLVVQFDRKTELGYRELLESDANLKRLLAKLEAATTDELKTAALSNLQPIITAANIAADECDFGTGLELGIDFFCQGCSALDKATLSLLKTGYSLLQRNEHFQIVQAHFEDRKKGIKLSILEN